MEILEITSAHSLTMSMTDKRPVGAHTYRVNCQQFSSLYKTWQKNGAVRSQPLGVMTLGFDRIWITAAEGAQVADAIAALRSPLALD
jgi:hypothetical protein